MDVFVVVYIVVYGSQLSNGIQFSMVESQSDRLHFIGSHVTFHPFHIVSAAFFDFGIVADSFRSLVSLTSKRAEKGDVPAKS